MFKQSKKLFALFTFASIFLTIFFFTSCQEEPTVTSEPNTSQQLSKFSLPAGATLVSGKLYIYMESGNYPGPRTVNIYRNTEDWDETTVDWSTRPAYDLTIEGTFSTDGAPVLKMIDITGLVQKWFNCEPNYGLLLDQLEETPEYETAVYSSKEGTNPEYLEIVYSIGGVNQPPVQVPAIADAYIWECGPAYNNAYLETGYVNGCEKQSLIKFDIECAPPDCGECDGKVTQLTLQYNGSSSADIVVKQKKDGIIVFDGTVAAGGQFTFNGADNKGTLGTEIIIYVDGNEQVRIHTSCSQPIGPGLIKGDFEVIDGYSRNGGRLCPIPPQPDCGECEGKVSQLTLQYNGGSTATIKVEQKKNHDIVFEGSVDPGGQFTFNGTDKGTLGTEIIIYVDGNEQVRIHTSCSQPIGPGLVKGDFEVIEGYSKKGGKLCPIPPPPPCGECDGKVSQLTLEYDGSVVGGTIKVKQKNGAFVFEGVVNPGESFTFNGTDNGTFGTEITLYVNDVENTKIHTSCSQPIGPGLVKGDFEVIEGYSKHGGKLCPIPPPGWCDGNKPQALGVRYTGEDCSASFNNQPSDKWSCSGDPLFTSPVVIKSQDKSNPTDPNAKVWFNGQVEIGDLFYIDATFAGDSKLKADTYVFVYDLSGNLLQTVKFHTSCSQPLEPGDQFGSIFMVEFVPEN